MVITPQILLDLLFEDRELQRILHQGYSEDLSTINLLRSSGVPHRILLPECQKLLSKINSRTIKALSTYFGSPVEVSLPKKKISEVSFPAFPEKQESPDWGAKLIDTHKIAIYREEDMIYATIWK